MTPGGGKKATAEPLARYGHIAAGLRAFLKARKWAIGDLNQAMGNERGHTGVYIWLNARGAPMKENRQKLAEVTGIPEIELMARSVKTTAKPPAVIERAVAIASAPTKRQEVLSFSVDDEGRARIRLDVAMPVEDATPLLRMLLDAGLVMGRAASE